MRLPRSRKRQPSPLDLNSLTCLGSSDPSLPAAGSSCSLLLRHLFDEGPTIPAEILGMERFKACRRTWAGARSRLELGTRASLLTPASADTAAPVTGLTWGLK